MILSMLYPAVDILYTRERTFSSCFKFREFYRLVRNNTASYFTTWLVVYGVSLGINMAISPVTILLSWIPFLGAMAAFIFLFASFIFTSFFTAHLYGQLGALAFGQNLVDTTGAATSL
jgi:ABC-type Na+ efflux pump permease subunit